MADYSPQDIADAMRRAGFPEQEIPRGVAISMAENTSRTLTSTNHSAIEHSTGPWQLNLYVPGTGQVVHGAAISEAEAQDLQASTNYAYQLWQAHGWNPWSVYLNGSYQQFLNQSDLGAPSVEIPRLPSTVDTVAQHEGQQQPLTPPIGVEIPNPFQGLPGAAPKLQAQVPTDILVKSGLSLVAVFVIVLGIVFIVASTPVAKAAIKAV